MYAVCTHRLMEIINVPFLDIIPHCFVFIALAAWALTFLGLLRRQVELLKAG
jgi:hypothetical protein